MYLFLHLSEKNIIAVHCKAGKGRTGVMIAAYLLHTRQPEATTPDGTPSARLALQFFRAARTTDLDAVVQPSQVRFIEQLLLFTPMAHSIARSSSASGV